MPNTSKARSKLNHRRSIRTREHDVRDRISNFKGTPKERAYMSLRNWRRFSPDWS